MPPQSLPRPTADANRSYPVTHLLGRPQCILNLSSSCTSSRARRLCRPPAAARRRPSHPTGCRDGRGRGAGARPRRSRPSPQPSESAAAVGLHSPSLPPPSKSATADPAAAVRVRRRGRRPSPSARRRRMRRQDKWPGGSVRRPYARGPRASGTPSGLRLALRLPESLQAAGRRHRRRRRALLPARRLPLIDGLPRHPADLSAARHGRHAARLCLRVQASPRHSLARWSSADLLVRIKVSRVPCPRRPQQGWSGRRHVRVSGLPVVTASAHGHRPGHRDQRTFAWIVLLILSLRPFPWPQRKELYI